MDAVPQDYRDDIHNTIRHIALIDRQERGDASEEALADLSCSCDGDTREAERWMALARQKRQERRALLVRQLAGLERSLARVEPLWAAARAAGAGTRLD